MEIDNINVESSGGQPGGKSCFDGAEEPQKDLNLEEFCGPGSVEQEDKNDQDASSQNNDVTHTCSDQTQSTDRESHQNDSPLRSDGSQRSSPVSVLETTSTEVEAVDRLLPRPSSPGQFANGPVTVSRSATVKETGSEDDESAQDALPLLEMSSTEVKDVDSLSHSHSPGQFIDDPVSRNLYSKQAGSKDTEGLEGASPTEGEEQCSSTGLAKEENGNSRGRMNSQSELCASDNVDQREGIVFDKPLPSSPGHFVDDPVSRSAPSMQAVSEDPKVLEGASPSKGEEEQCSSTGSAKEVGGNCRGGMNSLSEQSASENVDQRVGIVVDKPLPSSPGQFVDGPISKSSHAEQAGTEDPKGLESASPSESEGQCSTTGSAKEVNGNCRGRTNSQTEQCASDNVDQRVGIVTDSDGVSITCKGQASPPRQNPDPENTAGLTLKLDSKEETIHNSPSDHSSADNNTLSQTETMKSADVETGSKTTTSAVRTTVELDLGGSECTVVKFSSNTSQIVKEVSGRGSEEACYRLGGGSPKEMPGAAVYDNLPGSNVDVCNIEDAASDHSPGASFDHWQDNIDTQDGSSMNERRLEEGECYDDESCTFIKCPGCSELVISGQLMQHVIQCNAQPGLDEDYSSNNEEEEPTPPQDEETMEVECPECGVGFSKNEDLIIHIQIHEMLAKNARKVQESTRMKQLMTQAKEQMVMQDPVQQGRSSKCKVCHQRFTDPTMAPYHEMMHDKFPFHCKKCDMFFGTLLDLQRQRCGTKKHHKAFSYKCGTCQGVILHAHKMMKHRRKCKGKVEVCMLCKAKFNSFEDLKCHIEVCAVRKTGDMKPGSIDDGGLAGAYNCSNENVAMENHSDVMSCSDDARLSQEENNSEKCAVRYSPSSTTEGPSVSVDQVRNSVQLSGDIEDKDKDTFQKASSLNSVQDECSAAFCQLCGFELWETQPRFERSCKKPSKFCKECLKMNHRQLNKKSSVSELGADTNHGHPPTEQLPVHLEATDKSREGSIQKTERKKKEKRRKRKLGEICGACGKEFPDYESLADHAAGCNHVRLGKSCEIEPLAQETTEPCSELKVDWQCPQSERAKKKRCSKCNRTFWKDKKFQKHLKLCKVKRNSPLEPKNAVEVISSEDDFPLLSLQKRSKTVNDVNERENDASPLKTGGDPIERVKIKRTKTSLRSKDYHTYHSCKITGDEERAVEMVDSLQNCKSDIANEKGDAGHMMQEKHENAAFAVETSSVSSASMTNSLKDEDLSLRIGAEGKDTATKNRDDEGTDSPAGDDQQHSCLPLKQDVQSVPCNKRIFPPTSAETYEDTYRVEEAVEAAKQESVVRDGVSSMEPMNVGMSCYQATGINPNGVTLQDNVPVIPEEQATGNVIPTSGKSIGSTIEGQGSSLSIADVLAPTNGNSASQDSLKEVGLPDGPDKESINDKVSVTSSKFTHGQRSDCVASGSKEVEVKRRGQGFFNGSMIALPQEEKSGTNEHKYGDNQEGDRLSGKSPSREDLCTDFAETMVLVSGSPGNLVDGQSLDADAGSDGCFMPLVDENAALGHHCVYCAGEFRSREDLWEHAKGCRDNHLMVIAKAVNGVQEMQLVSPDERSCVPFTVLPDVGVASRRLREEIGVNLSKVGRDGIGADAIVEPEAKKAKRNRSRSRKFRTRYRYSKFGLIEFSDSKDWRLAMERRSPQKVDLSNVSTKKKKKKNKNEK